MQKRVQLNETSSERLKPVVANNLNIISFCIEKRDLARSKQSNSCFRSVNVIQTGSLSSVFGDSIPSVKSLARYRSIKQQLANDFKKEIFRLTERGFCFNDPNRYWIKRRTWVLVISFKQVEQPWSVKKVKKSYKSYS